jgi:hypothetical protein
MTQQIIDTGAAANDGTGEPLRDAFTAVNENFTEIYNAGPVGSNVVISGNTIAVNGVNNNLVLQANGIGNIQANSSIMPSVDAVYDIGSPTARIDTVYATYFVGNGSQLTGITGGSSYSNANVAAFLPTYSGNIGASNINATLWIMTKPRIAAARKGLLKCRMMNRQCRVRIINRNNDSTLNLGSWAEAVQIQPIRAEDVTKIVMSMNTLANTQKLLSLYSIFRWITMLKMASAIT